MNEQEIYEGMEDSERLLFGETEQEFFDALSEGETVKGISL